LGIESLVISASGIRGIVYADLSPDVVCRIGSALATFLGRGSYVVGRDTRPSGHLLRGAVMAGIAATGSDVIDVGICPTPTIQLAVEYERAKGGIAVTASHNPAEWNALKLLSGSGTFLVAEDVDRVVGLARSGPIAYADSAGSGTIRLEAEACERHMTKILALDLLRVDEIAARGFKVALDCTNGAGSVVASELLRRLGCRVFEIDCEPTGVFTRNPEPVSANIGPLCEAVKKHGADIGFALDPDGDRLAIVDEAGRPIGEDYTLVICTDLVLGRSKGPVVTNLSTTMAMEDVTRRHGTELVRAPIGEINVVEKMKAVSSVIGGEGNGGVILPALHYGRDALVGMSLVLEALLESGTTLSAMMKDYPRYDIVKYKIAIEEVVQLEALVAALEREFAGASFNFDDGLRIDLGRSWLHVRRSGTEPVIRLISEAADRRGSQGLIDRALEVIKTQGGS
jgi:phosphomannomutase